MFLFVDAAKQFSIVVSINLHSNQQCMKIPIAFFLPTFRILAVLVLKCISLTSNKVENTFSYVYGHLGILFCEVSMSFVYFSIVLSDFF